MKPNCFIEKKLHSHVHVAARNYYCSYRGNWIILSLNESMFEFLPFPLSVFFKYILYKNKLIVNLRLWFQILQQNYILKKLFLSFFIIELFCSYWCLYIEDHVCFLNGNRIFSRKYPNIYAAMLNLTANVLVKILERMNMLSIHFYTESEKNNHVCSKALFDNLSNTTSIS